jgi:hypothetical protein
MATKIRSIRVNLWVERQSALAAALSVIDALQSA